MRLCTKTVFYTRTLPSREIYTRAYVLTCTCMWIVCGRVCKCNIAMATKTNCEYAPAAGGFRTGASARARYEHVGRSVCARQNATNILSQCAHSSHALSRSVCVCVCARSLYVCVPDAGCGSCCLATRCCRMLRAYLAASVWLEQENESVKSEPARRGVWST